MKTIHIDSSKMVKARENQGFTQSEAARRVGISRQQLWNYERGLFAVPSDILARLCALYKVPISTLTNAPQIFFEN